MADHWTGGPRTGSAATNLFVEAKMRAAVMIIKMRAWKKAASDGARSER
jgi:hypothetical protein